MYVNIPLCVLGDNIECSLNNHAKNAIHIDELSSSDHAGKSLT